jgi:hypothetical protein
MSKVQFETDRGVLENKDDAIGSSARANPQPSATPPSEGYGAAELALAAQGRARRNRLLTFIADSIARTLHSSADPCEGSRKC